MNIKLIKITWELAQAKVKTISPSQIREIQLNLLLTLILWMKTQSNFNF